MYPNRLAPNHHTVHVCKGMLYPDWKHFAYTMQQLGSVTITRLYVGPIYPRLYMQAKSRRIRSGQMVYVIYSFNCNLLYSNLALLSTYLYGMIVWRDQKLVAGRICALVSYKCILFTGYTSCLPTLTSVGHCHKQQKQFERKLTVNLAFLVVQLLYITSR